MFKQKAQRKVKGAAAASGRVAAEKAVVEGDAQNPKNDQEDTQKDLLTFNFGGGTAFDRKNKIQ